MKVQNTSNIEAPWMHWFIYGDTGSGKTTIASQFPKPLFLVPKNESSMVTLAGQNVDYITLTGMRDPYEDGEGGLNAVMDAIEAEYAANPEQFYETIVLESLSHFTDLVQEELTQGGSMQMDQQKWGKLASAMRNIQSRLRNLDVHAVFTSLAKVDQDAAGNAVGSPLIPGQSAYKLPSACDVIAFCEARDLGKKQRKYLMHLKTHKYYPARSRFKALPSCIENFDFDEVAELVSPSQNQTTKAAE
jgi:hypothetical protein